MNYSKLTFVLAALLATATATARTAHAGFLDALDNLPSIPPPAFSKSFDKSQAFGTADWGANYMTQAYVSQSSGAQISLLGLGEVYARAKLNGTSHDLIRLMGRGEITLGSKGRYEVTAKIGSSTVYSKRAEATVADKNIASSRTWTQNLVKVNHNFTVGPVPVTVRFEANGQLGLVASGSISLTKLQAEVRPSAGAHLVASAGAGIDGFSVGIYGDLTLLEASLSAVASIQYVSGKVGHRVAATLELQALKGELGVYAEGLSKRYDKEFFEANGLLSTFSLGSSCTNMCPTKVGPFGGFAL